VKTLFTTRGIAEIRTQGAFITEEKMGEWETSLGKNGSECCVCGFLDDQGNQQTADWKKLIIKG